MGVDPILSGQTQRPFPGQVRVISRGRREKDVRETWPTLPVSEAEAMAKNAAVSRSWDGPQLADRKDARPESPNCKEPYMQVKEGVNTHVSWVSGIGFGLLTSRIVRCRWWWFVRAAIGDCPDEDIETVNYWIKIEYVSNDFISVLIKDFSHALISDWTKVEIEFSICTWVQWISCLGHMEHRLLIIRSGTELLKCHLEYFCHSHDHLYPCKIKQRRDDLTL